MSTNHAVLAVDLGKTGCRVRYVEEDGAAREGLAEGAVGLAGVDGAQQVTRALEAALTVAVPDPREREAVAPRAVALGVAGYQAAVGLREELARRIAERWGAAVALTSDVTTTHLGALAGVPGVVVAAGTGAVALGVAEDGTHTVHDGWGFLLGDDGSGYAIGRAGLRAALAHQEGGAGSADLARRAQEVFGPLEELPAVVHGAAHPSRLIASFAPHVAGSAEAGDSYAQRIWQDAGRTLARLALGAAADLQVRTSQDAPVPLCLAGGLPGVGELLTAPFAKELQRAGAADVRAAEGSALDGADHLARLVLGQLPQTWQGLVTVHRPGASGASAAGASGAAEPAASAGVHAAPAGENLAALSTESARSDLADLDQWPTVEVLRTLWMAEAEVPRALLEVAESVALAADLAAERLRSGGRMYYVGAGTPARLAFVDASELPPTFGTSPDLVQALTAGGQQAVLRAKEGAEDDGEAGRCAVREAQVGEKDVVVGLTASGRTPFVLDALREARELGALTIGVSANQDAALSAVAEHPVEVLTGTEVISGSTRLKAGSAQKMFLNGLSTAVMVRLGKTYGPYMVDMQATNHKLRARAERMVTTVTGAPAAQATAALEGAGWSTKTAIVMLLRGVDADEARALLERSGGAVRGALEAR